MSAGSEPLVVTTKALTLAGCLKVMAAAQAEAARHNVKLSLVVLDAGGHLLHFVRMDDCHPGTIEIAMGKARCAALFRRPIKMFAERYAAGATELAILPNVFPFSGGVPIMVDGHCIGAVGASGATGEIDEQVAQAGAAALQA